MTDNRVPMNPPTSAAELAHLIHQYGCGPIPFTGTDGFYERHLVFDNVSDPA